MTEHSKLIAEGSICECCGAFLGGPFGGWEPPGAPDRCNDCLPPRGATPEPIEITVRGQIERGWWVAQTQWFAQKLFPLTGVWPVVRLTNGDITNGVLLVGYEGWRDGNYRRIKVAQWFKPARWFASPEDMEGKAAEYAAYRNAVLHDRTSPLRAQAHKES